MKIKSDKLKVFSSWVFLGVLFISSILFGILTSSKPSTLTNTRAAAPAGKIIPVAGGGDGTVIQQAIDSAKDGDTISISGSYSGGTAVPLGLGGDIKVSDSRGGSETCFIRIEGKNITLKGGTLYGEGHAKPYQDPYQHRAGLCIINSTVTIDGVRIKEFQKRGAVVYNSSIVVKNSTTDGCDEGGYSLLGNSSGLFLNNYFVGFNFGGIMLWQNAQVKIVNNIFYGANIMFFYHPNTADTAHAEIINNIFSNGSAVTQVDWWTSELPKLKNNKLSYNDIWNDGKACGANDYCDAFPGKIEADPLYEGAAIDPTGWVYGSLDLKQGSPGIGAGDPSIPGTKNLGPSGGPCTDPNSSTCTDFISKNMPTSGTPSPTPAPTEASPTATPVPTGNPTTTPSTAPSPTQPASSSSSSSQSSSRVPTKPLEFPGLLTINNVGTDKLYVQGVFLKTNYDPIDKFIDTKQATPYLFKYECTSSNEEIDGGVLYTNSKGETLYTKLHVFCNKTNAFDIQ